ncbi:hypothetical protein [Amycolatopsis kentuckyensis]|uniref:hypothetical protein n=1 Tax=Amycolatopsis kentuckyensis TaxID=218823 RepID=UPI003563C7D8
MTEPTLFSLENQRESRPLDVVSWGAGVESPAYLTEILTNPTRHDVDPENLVVLHAVVGSEFTDTITLSHIGNPGYQNLRTSRSSGSRHPVAGHVQHQPRSAEVPEAQQGRRLLASVDVIACAVRTPIGQPVQDAEASCGGPGRHRTAR